MKIKLPKDLRGITFHRVLTIELNTFDIDSFLPLLFFTILAEGRGKAKQANKDKETAYFIDKLSQHPAMQGFDDQEGRRVLERLVRTTLITTGGIGRALDRGEQIVSITPYTLLAHKPGFPVEGSRQRKADVFIYQVLRERMLQDDDALRQAVKDIFGRGVIIGPRSELGGTYDGKTKLDTLTRLSIAFLDGFETTKPGITREKNVPSSCPALSSELATDLLCYLLEYHECMPTHAFTHHLLALINFELFAYTLKLVHAINALVRQPDILPPAMRSTIEPSPPQLYLDFTETSKGHSQEMAKACVRRDVEAYQQFLSSNLLLRQLDQYIEKLRRSTQRQAIIENVLPPSLSGAEYLQKLLLLQQDPTIGPSIDALAQLDEDRIRQENTNTADEGDAEAHKWLDDVASTGGTDIERVVNLLAEGQRESGIQHFIQWYWGVGGMKKTHGLLRGSMPHRQTWRYAPSNDLLAVLVQLAAIRHPASSSENVKGLRPIRLQEFLLFLEQRFGILIDRPPAPFEGAEYTAAAHDNLRAMLRRLRQMGIFRDLSDDFTVQSLYPLYSNEAIKRMEVK